ncbi:MAG: Ig-like domain-containing protein, partial [Treponema sp.]|nr:Ig-like domain-containing protein [Treponema sp.]
MHKAAPVLLLILLFQVSVSVQIFAGGRKDNESHEAGDPQGFTDVIDISGKKSGKWNIYMEAQDKGGNTTIAGPHNIFIDPESDLPVASIINPQPNMRVQGNLNIVGTCIDDDGVDHVELLITRGSDGKGEVMLETRAEGSEFWTYFLDTSDTEKWKDGAYTVSAWGVDINGLSGISNTFPVKSQKKHTITWNLDRKKPEIAVTSHSLGALVSGKVTIKGTVWDGNGVDSLSYSINEGVSYQPINLKYNKNENIYNFEFSLD